MTDTEISKALALAIGWPESDIDASNSAVHVCFEVATLEYPPTWRLFDYKIPDIIWPIAERYDCFPLRPFGKCGDAKWLSVTTGFAGQGDTAAKAVALAVIGTHAPK